MSDVHRNHPEATAAEIELIQMGQLLGAPVTQASTLERQCRNCGDDFLVAEALVVRRSYSKWTTLCSFCLANEL